jgi:quercetin dioxygenase-like cupin family protein/DNA-binding XRE family transcriptional regulator
LVSQVETGKTQPSVSTLYALCNYLGLSIDDLLDNDPSYSTSTRTSCAPSEESPGIGLPTVQRAADNPSIEMENGVRWERLAISEDHLAEPLLVTYAPGASSSIEGRLMRHSGVEYAYILEGQLTLQLEFDTYILSPGDSLQFDSSRPHMYANHGAVVAKGVWNVIGRRQQNDAMPSAPESNSQMGTERLSELNSAVDVLQAMDRMKS